MEASKQEKTIKDYLHFYLGCKFIHNVHKGVFELCGYNIYEAYAQNSLGVSTFDARQIKLILRPLSDMTEEEDQIEFPKHNRGEFIDMHWYPEGYVWLLSKGFDLFGLIDAGLAIQKPLPL